MSKKNNDPVVKSKAKCTSVACSHVTGGHCLIPMCANYREDCPVHAR